MKKCFMLFLLICLVFADLMPVMAMDKEDFSKPQVIEANDGLEACQIIQEEKVDLAIIDLMMPKLDRYQHACSLHKSF
ncbi:hypothetical protein [Streptococcus uberis]|uniref:hypothetical protein n=1 Tax=Streptococcus uberis TaxID=1349 RepID=UPI0020C0EE8E|nr:hypothetical protein [Streptococcus uberis]MEE3698558.1 hypothetical protein [Streptococcus uberis]